MHDQNNINPIFIVAIILLLSSLTKNTKYIESQSNPPAPSDADISVEKMPIKSVPVKSISKSKINLDQIMNPDQIIDKLTHITDVMKQVNRLNNIKNTALSGNGSLDHIQEAFGIVKNILPENKQFEKLNNLDSMINNIKKFGDIKKMMDLQSTLAPLLNTNNSGGGLDDILKVVAPLISNANDSGGDNIENLQKIMKMANLISSLNNSSENN